MLLPLIYPSLKEFVFVKQFNKDIVKENTMNVAKICVLTKEFEESDVELFENDKEERPKTVENINKNTKCVPLAEFRNASSVSRPRKSSNLTAEVNKELCRYSSISGVNLQQAGVQLIQFFST